MNGCGARPSQVARLLGIGLLCIGTLLCLSTGLQGLPSLLAAVQDWLGDRLLVPGCWLRKQPLLQVCGPSQGAAMAIRVLWEGRCPDPETKVFFRRVEGTGEFDHPENFEYNRLAEHRHFYAAVLEGLLPDASYEYYVEYRGRRTGPRRFSLPPSLAHGQHPSGQDGKQDSVRVGVIGDSQSGSSQFRRLLKDLQYHHPVLLMHLGDAVQHADRLAEWHRFFFAPLQHYLPGVPVIAVSGNHDWWEGRPGPYLYDDHGVDPDRAADRPPKTPPHQASYFAVTVGAARLIVLDSQRQGPEQTAWLEAELAGPAASKAAFRIVSVHVPPFIEFWDMLHWRAGDRNWPLFTRNTWVPLFKKYHVDLVLSGHQHNYQRGARDSLTLVVSGGGGGGLDRVRVEDHRLYRVTVFEHHYLLLDIHPDSLKLTALAEGNRVIDEIVLERNVLKRYNNAQGGNER